MSSKVTAAAVSKNFDIYEDAAGREPVIITRDGRPKTVLIAYEDYLRLMKRDRQVELTADLTDDELAAIETSEMEPGLEYLDAELTVDKKAAG